MYNMDMDLSGAIKRSWDALSFHRDLTMKAVRAIVGRWDSEETRNVERIVPLVSLARIVFIQNLLPGAPRFVVRSSDLRYAPVARIVSAYFESVLDSIRFRDVVEDTVSNALLSPLGVVRVGVSAPNSGVFARSISVFDWVEDMDAATRDDARFFGYVMRLRKEDVAGCPLFDARKRAEAAEGRADRSGFVKILEVYTRSDNLVRWYCFEDGRTGDLLGSGESAFPDGGYEVLEFFRVPPRRLAVPPAALWLPLADLANAAMLKVARAARDFKSVTVLPRPAKGDAAALLKAGENAVVESDMPNAARSVPVGAPPDALMPFVEAVRRLFSWSVGGLDVMGGLAPMADTLGQEKMLQSMSSRQVAFMRDKTADFLRRVGETLLRAALSDPFLDREMQVSLPFDAGVENVRLRAEMVRKAVRDMRIELVPYAGTGESPDVKAEKLKAFMAAAAPLLPAMERQGASLDISAFVRKLAELSGIGKDADDMIVMAGGAGAAEGG